MKHAPQIVLALTLMLGVSACGVYRPDRALRVATGVAAHDLCSETFVSGLDPDLTFAESLKPRPGFGSVAWAMHYAVDRQQREVRTSIVGTLESRARFRAGAGCVLVHGSEAVEAPRPIAAPAAADALLPAIAGPAVVAPADPALKAMLDAAFAEPQSGPLSQTKAVLVLRDGQVVAERYALGYGVDTPILGFSLSKSVINALVGILVRDGKLDVHAAAPVGAWQQDPADPRRAITVEQLMRMTSGLDLDESGSGFDPSNQMFYLAADMGAHAARARLKAAPGSRWFYSSASVHLLARIVRDRVGGKADDVLAFAARELYAPLGMRHVTMEMDATGTPIGAHYMLASARDWARLGSLFLNDGVVGGKRILPAGWVAFSTTPTLDTDYGAGWWPNRTQNPNGERTSRLDMPLVRGVPKDMFYALGNLGQYLAVIPSERMVVVRLGRSHGADFGVRGFEDLVVAAVAAVKPPVQ